MTLFGLSPTLFWLGAAGFLAALLGLHLLRVRLRHVAVDTLLFFRLAGVRQQPRTLPGRPARWWAFLLALLLVMAGWGAFARPRTGLDAPSRFVVVEPGPDPAARLAAAAPWTAALGPRGAVVAAGWPPRTLRAADEPAGVLAARTDVLAGAAIEAGTLAALQAVAAQRRAGDQVVFVGARPPGVADVVHVPLATAPVRFLRQLAWERAEAGELLLRWTVGPEPLRGELRHGGQVLARCEDGSWTSFVPPAGAAAVELVVDGAPTMTLPLPEPVPARVWVDPTLAEPLQRAVVAVLAVDAELAPAPAAASAEVLVTAAPPQADERRPCLVLTPGVGAAARCAVATAESPVACSLRDMQRRSAGALAAADWASVWIADAETGGALAASRAGGRLEVQLVDWLCEPITHADVPLLLAAALRELAGRPRALLQVAGQPLRLPAAFGRATAPAPTAAAGGLLLAAGATANVPTVAGERAVHVIHPTFAPVALPTPTTAPTPAGIGGDGALWPWLLALLLLLAVVDGILFHRGRLP